MSIFSFLFHIFIIIVLIIVLSINVSYFAQLKGKKDIHITQDKVNAGYWINLILLILVIITAIVYFVWYIAFRKEPNEDTFTEMANEVFCESKGGNITQMGQTRVMVGTLDPLQSQKVKTPNIIIPKAEYYGGNVYYSVPQ